jgi:hypothetical protein
MSFDITNASDLLSLKTEVNTDPEGVGYAPDGLTQELLDALNIESNNPQPNDQTPIPFDVFPMVDVIDEINNAEYGNLNPRKLATINAIINAGVSDPSLAFGHVKKVFKSAFGADSTTWANVKDDRMRHASRAESLFGRDTVLSRNDWFAARDS